MATPGKNVRLLPPRPRPGRRHEDSPSHERWLVSYADFITLLFAFFTTLYAISTVDAMKLRHVAAAMHEAFSPKAAPIDSDVPPPPSPRMPVKVHAEVLPGDEVELTDLQNTIAQRLAQSLAENRIDMQRDERGLVVSIREAGSFPTGSAELSAEARTLLLELGAVLSTVGNRMRIEGHTDDRPIHTVRFASNWELSTARATSVLAFLLEHAQLRPDQLGVAGYGEYHPRAANSSEANRTLNRRVDIVILNARRASEEPHRRS